VVLLGLKYSRLRLASGKYTFPSTVSVVSLSAIVLPFQIARAMVDSQVNPQFAQLPALPGVPNNFYQTSARCLTLFTRRTHRTCPGNHVDWKNAPEDRAIPFSELV
jgi:hypothetical protein